MIEDQSAHRGGHQIARGVIDRLSLEGFTRNELQVDQASAQRAQQGEYEDAQDD